MNVIFCPSSAGSLRPTVLALVSSIGLVHLTAREVHVVLHVTFIHT